MSKSCCLCGHSLNDPHYIMKHKKLYGVICLESREYLKRIIVEATGLHLDSYIETQQANALLCHQCDGKLKKLRILRDEIYSNISALHPIETTRLSQSTDKVSGQKRASAGSVSHAKQARIDTSQHEVSDEQLSLETMQPEQQSATPVMVDKHSSVQQSDTTFPLDTSEETFPELLNLTQGHSPSVTVSG